MFVSKVRSLLGRSKVVPQGRQEQQLCYRSLEQYLLRSKADYLKQLDCFFDYCDSLAEIPWETESPYDRLPQWNNAMLAGLDLVALFHFIHTYRPQRYVEIGSGTSTKVARLAIQKAQLKTSILSIDPDPRSPVEAVCDRRISVPLQDAPLDCFSELQANDVVFLDGSHQAHACSDVSVFFLELLPKIPPGVLIQVHDIFLPWDYPLEWSERHYSEQYLLACYLLAQPEAFKVLLPNQLIRRSGWDKALDPFWTQLPHPNIPRGGCSFWFTKLAP